MELVRDNASSRSIPRWLRCRRAQCYRGKQLVLRLGFFWISPRFRRRDRAVGIMGVLAGAGWSSRAATTGTAEATVRVIAIIPLGRPAERGGG